MRPEALDALRGVDLILHAGDVGSSEVLETLKGIAPVVAVRGNNDKGGWAEEREAFSRVFNQEEAFINSLLQAGMNLPPN